MVPVPQMDSFLLKGMDTTNQIAPNKNVEQRASPTINPFMKYGT
jgi:hypothetical protein